MCKSLPGEHRVKDISGGRKGIVRDTDVQIVGSVHEAAVAWGDRRVWFDRKVKYGGREVPPGPYIRAWMFPSGERGATEEFLSREVKCLHLEPSQ